LQSGPKMEWIRVCFLHSELILFQVLLGRVAGDLGALLIFESNYTLIRVIIRLAFSLESFSVISIHGLGVHRLTLLCMLADISETIPVRDAFEHVKPDWSLIILKVASLNLQRTDSVTIWCVFRLLLSKLTRLSLSLLRMTLFGIVCLRLIDLCKKVLHVMLFLSIIYWSNLSSFVIWHAHFDFGQLMQGYLNLQAWIRHDLVFCVHVVIVVKVDILLTSGSILDLFAHHTLVKLTLFLFWELMILFEL